MSSVKAKIWTEPGSGAAPLTSCVAQRRNRTTGSDWVAETHAYPLAAAASGVRHRASNSSIYHVDHDMYDGASARAPVLQAPYVTPLHPQEDMECLRGSAQRHTSPASRIRSQKLQGSQQAGSGGCLLHRRSQMVWRDSCVEQGLLGRSVSGRAHEAIPDDWMYCFPRVVTGWRCCAADPNAVHYCWNVGVEDHDWKWYKHWFQHFNWAMCPPWPAYTNKHRRGLFPHPPRPLLLKSQARSAPATCALSQSVRRAQPLCPVHLFPGSAHREGCLTAPTCRAPCQFVQHHKMLYCKIVCACAPV